MVGKRQREFIKIVEENFLHYFDIKGEILVDKYDEFVNLISVKVKELWSEMHLNHFALIKKFIANVHCKKSIEVLKTWELFGKHNY